jgi:hypothetical protein
MAPVRRLAELTRHECLGLLGSISYGRVVFTSQALPAIRPVNHVLVGEKIIIRTTAGAVIASAVNGTGTVVAYEADLIDAEQRLGWTVVVVGRANRVLSAAQIARYREALVPWTDADTDADEVISIAAGLVTGYRMIPATAGEPGTSRSAIPVPRPSEIQ